VTACSPLLHFFNTFALYIFTYVCCYLTSIPACCTVCSIVSTWPIAGLPGFLAQSSASASLQCATALLQHFSLRAATYIHLKLLVHGLLICHCPSAGLIGVPAQPAGNGCGSRFCAGPSRTAAAMGSVKTATRCCADSTPLCCCTSVWSGYAEGMQFPLLRPADNVGVLAAVCLLGFEHLLVEHEMQVECHDL